MKPHTPHDKPSNTVSFQDISLDTSKCHWNLDASDLIELTLKQKLGHLADSGALVVETGSHTGRSPHDKFIVKEPTSQDSIWWSEHNQPLSNENFTKLLNRTLDHLKSKEVFVQDLYAGAHPEYRIPFRIVTEDPWHNLFARQLLIRPKRKELSNFKPDFLLLNTPSCEADPKRNGTHSGVYIVIHFGRKIILVGGTGYAGEIKKSIFTVLNFIYPQKGIMAMHSSANRGKKGDVAVFFGLSGTGKTTLSADPARGLIGDDEHGWAKDGVFNFEGGCYAKCINLSKEYEPQIYHAIRFGALAENVAMDSKTKKIDFADRTLTENTRVAYPLDHIQKINTCGGRQQGKCR